jgi:pyruvate kinase
MKLTKIIATLGPASDSEETITKLISSGVNIFRFNTKHGTTTWHEERIRRVQRVADTMEQNIGILLDLQGPEIRLETRDKQDIKAQAGEIIRITPSFVNMADLVCIPHPSVFHALKLNHDILIDDGSIRLTVREITDHYILAESPEDCTIKHRKGVNLPGVKINLPSLIADDLDKLDMASINRVDFVALSFCRNQKDIDILKQEMAKRNIQAKIIAKIESDEAVQNLDEIMSASDIIMIARGDLGVETPIERLAHLQKQIIRKCRLANKPVIVATQMLESMIQNPTPTRAEATDVANAIFDGTDAIMLSGETASGNHPVRAVQAMARIAGYNETIRPTTHLQIPISNSTDLIINGLVQILDQSIVKFKCILVFSHSGKTARAIATLRPKLPIIAITPDQRIVEELTISYGISAHASKLREGDFSLPNKTTDWLLESGVVETGDTILVIHGQHYYKEGSTNSLAIYTI